MNELVTNSGTVRVRDLRFRYGGGSFELQVDDLEFAKGEPVALIGPSGCGKTTFLHLVAGILEASHGAIDVGGQSISDFADSARRAFRISRVGLIFQEFELLDHLSVRENILLPFFINSRLKHDRAVDDKLQSLARRVGIEPDLDRRPRELSQGERQRVAICRALITEPSLVLADEPTGNLDPETSGEVLDLLLEETAQHGATLLVVTHDHGVLDRFQRVVDFRDLVRPADGGSS